MSTWVRVVAGMFGLALQLIVLDAAIRTFLLPRVANVRFSRTIGVALRWCFNLIAGPTKSYPTRDRVLSMYASILLLTYQAMWLLTSMVAFAFAFIAAGAPSFSSAFDLSGSSLFTLGTFTSHGAPYTTLEFAEAGVGLTLLALLIAFIPTLVSGVPATRVVGVAPHRASGYPRDALGRARDRPERRVLRPP